MDIEPYVFKVEQAALDDLNDLVARFRLPRPTLMT